MKLYDMEAEEHPTGKGPHNFRSRKVYKCAVCGCLSNEFRSLIGYPGYPPILCCPGCRDKQALHFLLWEKLEKTGDDSYPKIFLLALQVEIMLIRWQFRQISPDIQGPVEKWKGVELEELIGQ